MGSNQFRGAAAFLLAAGLALGGCADAPPPAAAPVAAASPAHASAQAATPAPASAAPGGIVLEPQQQGTLLANDPSAPADTPLCGLQAREANAIGQGLLPQQYAQAGVCSSFACFDPATATYLGADGYRHVCR